MKSYANGLLMLLAAIIFVSFLYFMIKDARKANVEWCEKYKQDNILLIEECIQKDKHSALYCERMINPERFCHR